MLKKRKYLIFTIIFILIAMYFFDIVEDYKKPLKFKKKVDYGIENKKFVNLKYIVGYFTWVGAVINLAIFSFLAITSKFWFSVCKPTSDKILFKKQLINKSYIGLVFLVFILASLPRLARLNHALWFDEEWAFRVTSYGEHQKSNSQEFEFKEHSHFNSWYFNRNTNNHVLHTLFQKISWDSWKFLLNKEPDEFVEWVLKLPSFIFGMSSLLGVVCLFIMLGKKWAGLWAMVFLAMHPWHIQYSSEGRGYSTMFCFLVFALCFMIKALEKQKWRYWILYSFFIMFALMSHIAFAYNALAINFAIVLFLIFRKDFKEHSINQLKKWFLCNTITAGLFIYLTLPQLFQSYFILNKSKMFTWKIKLNHIILNISEFFTGVRLKHENHINPNEIVLNDISGGSAFLHTLIVLSIIGLIVIIKKYGWRSLLIVTTYVATYVMYIYCYYTHKSISVTAYIFSGFIGYILILFILFYYINKYWLNKTKRLGSLSYIFNPVLIFLVISFLIFFKKNKKLMIHAKEDYKNITIFTRNSKDVYPYKQKDNIEVASLWRSWPMYDPKLIVLNYHDFLPSLINKCFESNKKLIVVIGHIDLAKELNEDIMNLVNDKNLFVQHKIFWGYSNLTTLRPYILINNDTSKKYWQNLPKIEDL